MANGWHRKRLNDPATLARVKQYRSPAYKAARAAVKVQVDAGIAHCWRCGKPIPPRSKWHLGHNDTDRSILMGAEHARCNLRAAARNGAQVANGKRRRRITALPM